MRVGSCFLVEPTVYVFALQQPVEARFAGTSAQLTETQSKKSATVSLRHVFSLIKMLCNTDMNVTNEIKNLLVTCNVLLMLKMIWFKLNIIF